MFNLQANFLLFVYLLSFSFPKWATCARDCPMLVQSFQQTLSQNKTFVKKLDELVGQKNKEGFLAELEQYYRAGIPYSNSLLILKNGMLLEHLYQSMLNTPIEDTELEIVGSGIRAAIYKQSLGDSANSYEISRYAFSIWMQSYFFANGFPYENQLLIHPSDAYNWIRNERSPDEFLASPVISVGVLASHFFYGRRSTFLNTEITKIEYDQNQDFPLKVFYNRDGLSSFVRHKELLFTVGLGGPAFPTDNQIFKDQILLASDDPNKTVFALDEFLAAPLVTTSIVERAIQKKIFQSKNNIVITLIGGNHGSAIVAEGLVSAVEKLREKSQYKNFDIKVNWVGLPNPVKNNVV